MINSDFSDAKVGDKVTSLLWGHGEIIYISECSDYPINCHFDSLGEWIEREFTLGGHYEISNLLPTLFKGHIDPASFAVSYKIK